MGNGRGRVASDMVMEWEEKNKGGEGKSSGGAAKRDWFVKVQLLVFALLLATGAWMILVFSAKNQCTQGNSARRGPPTSFLWSDASAGDGEPSEFSVTSSNGSRRDSGSLSLQEIVFGIAGSSQLWPQRKEFIKLWWRPTEMRGFVWLEDPVKEEAPGEPLPQVMVSEDTSRFSYTHALGHPSGIRISRVVSETFRLGLPNVKWFVMGDDDTLFNPDNLVRVLNKYDPSEFFYIGSSSESHRQNAEHFSHMMAYGGGGFAISYSLAEAIAGMQDKCLERYPQLFGSDDRLHACISELGVPLTIERGFHQLDMVGQPFGLLAAHPIAPFLSIHHLQLMNPLVPGKSASDGLRLLSKAMQTEPSSFLQNSMCYDQKRSLSFSIASGFVVQVFPHIIFPSTLQRPLTTFSAWNRLNDPMEFSFDTRPEPTSVCKQPFRFFLEKMIHDENTDTTISVYRRLKSIDDEKKKALCWSRAIPPAKVQRIRVVSRPLGDHWFNVPRRQCCRLTGVNAKVLGITVDSCRPGEQLTG